MFKTYKKKLYTNDVYRELDLNSLEDLNVATPIEPEKVLLGENGRIIKSSRQIIMRPYIGRDKM